MYQYTDLDRESKEIRLLILEPGSGDEVVHCSLEHAFLTDSPPPSYETISYVCGDPNTKTTIILHDSEFFTPKTAERALRRMRLPDARRTLWIDAVCINQADVEELGHQVGLMYAIYSNTWRTLVWLGEDHGIAPRTWDIIKAMLQEMVNETPDDEHLVLLLKNPLTEGARMLPATYGDFDTDVMLDLFELPWFSRLWVVQEASLAPISFYHYGDREGPLLELLAVASWVLFKAWRLSHAFPFGLMRASSMFRSIEQQHEPDPAAMMQCLIQQYGFEATDPKDHAYAILGLWQKRSMKSELPAILKPDYTLCISTIFRNTARFAIDECKDLSLLGLSSVWREGKQSLSWPSWVPHFDCKYVEDLHARRLSTNFHADDKVHMSVHERSSLPGALVVSGILVDQITLVGTERMTTESTVNEVKAILKAQEHTFGGDCAQTHPEQHIKAIAMALRAGQSYDARISDTQALEEYRAYKQHLNDHENFPMRPKDESCASLKFHRSAMQCNYNMLSLQRNRALFGTGLGHVGLGPDCVRAGDVVAILYGCSCPVVLRPTLETGEYSLLGMAYVYGIMDGEAVQEHKAMGLEDTEFCIV